MPEAISASAVTTTPRTPNFPIRAAANGAVKPYRTKLTVIAPEVSARDHPNSASSGSIRAPVVERNDAAANSAAKVAVTPSCSQSCHDAGRTGSLPMR